MRLALGLVALSGLALLIAVSPRSLPQSGKPLVVLEAVHLWREVPAGRMLDVSFHLRNAGDAPALVQTEGTHGYFVRAELLDPQGFPVPLRPCCGGPQDCGPLDEHDFTELAPGACTRALKKVSPLAVPQVRGRHLLRFSYHRERPEAPTLWERTLGATVTRKTQAAMDHAFHGTLQGQIEIDVY